MCTAEDKFRYDWELARLRPPRLCLVPLPLLPFQGLRLVFIRSLPPVGGLLERVEPVPELVEAAPERFELPLDGFRRRHPVAVEQEATLRVDVHALRSVHEQRGVSKPRGGGAARGERSERSERRHEVAPRETAWHLQTRQQKKRRHRSFTRPTRSIGMLYHMQPAGAPPAYLAPAVACTADVAVSLPLVLLKNRLQAGAPRLTHVRGFGGVYAATTFVGYQLSFRLPERPMVAATLSAALCIAGEALTRPWLTGRAACDLRPLAPWLAAREVVFFYGLNRSIALVRAGRPSEALATQLCYGGVMAGLPDLAAGRIAARPGWRAVDVLRWAMRAPGEACRAYVQGAALRCVSAVAIPIMAVTLATDSALLPTGAAQVRRV